MFPSDCTPSFYDRFRMLDLKVTVSCKLDASDYKS